MLRALRVSRGWDVPRMARELRAAAVEIGESVAVHGALVKQIRLWEKGTRRPTERYLLLYQRVAGDEGLNGTVPHPPDPAAVLDRARRLPGPAEITAALTAEVEAARRRGASPPDPGTVLQHVLELERQIAVIRGQLELMITEDRRPADG